MILILGVCTFLLLGLTVESLRNPARKKPAGTLVLGGISVVLVLLGFLAILLTLWSKQEYGDLPIDHILITFLSPTTGGSALNSGSLLTGPVLLALSLAVLYALFLFFGSGRHHRMTCLILTCLIFLGGLAYGSVRFHLDTLFRSCFQHSALIEETYRDPRQADLRFPEQKRNFIHIYLESMENSFMDRENGGYMQENLIPELTDLAGEGYHFSHRSAPFGGPEPVFGTTWSVASMVNMSTGLPMKIPARPDAYRRSDCFLPGACALGDLLAQQGYTQTVMLGADAAFGGLSCYFRTHGNFRIMDLQYAKQVGTLPHDYHVWWGYEDDKLYDYAKEELTRLSRTGKPFHFLMETADTHRPEGYLSPLAPAPYENQYANVLSYSSAEAVRFIRWIQSQPFYENTTILITGDHLSMETHFFEHYRFDPNYRRSQYNLILNPSPQAAAADPKVFLNREYANFDFFPTILTALGVTYEGNRLGMGTDLFSGHPTLLEEMGVSALNRELQKGSVFYNREILKISP